MQLEIKGNKLGLQWGLGCFEIATELLKDVSTVQDVMFRIDNDADMARIAYAALQNWCEIKEIDNPITLREFQAWLDESDEKVATSIIEDFMASKYQGRVMSERYDELVAMITAFEAEEKEGDKPKKKVVKKKATTSAKQ